MGIMIPIARAILRLHKQRPLSGKGLLLGRQTVPATIEGARRLITEESVPLRDITPEIDTTTATAKGQNFISDLSFINWFSDLELSTMDVSPYEGAQIIHDLNYPVPEALAGSFDFVFNGSCFDNMFDGAQGLRNIGRLLRPGGRVVSIEMGSPHNGPYVLYSQAWFFDYFAANNFANCHVYSCVFPPDLIWAGPYEVFAPEQYPAHSSLFPSLDPRQRAIVTLAIAEAGPDATWDRMPIQHHYRSDHAPYSSAAERYGSSGLEFGNLNGPPVQLAGFKKLGTL